MVCAVYRNGTVAEGTFRKWFTRFRSRDFDLETENIAERPTVMTKSKHRFKIIHIKRHGTSKIYYIYFI